MVDGVAASSLIGWLCVSGIKQHDDQKPHIDTRWTTRPRWGGQLLGDSRVARQPLEHLQTGKSYQC